MAVELRLNLIATSSGGVIFLWDYETFKMYGACSNDLEDVHKLSFIYPYVCLISIDTSSTITFWTWVQINAYKYMQPVHKIALELKMNRTLICN